MTVKKTTVIVIISVIVILLGATAFNRAMSSQLAQSNQAQKDDARQEKHTAAPDFSMVNSEGILPYDAVWLSHCIYFRE